ncbi:Transcription factor 1 [Pseudocercospora fuligena]|uniref:Transcription factor 1 n=1 Tax=Pseudocercospora fuligena TaxID=685502 RepID=A0A8H6RDM1_9PEZI|nr:Transcription factor 1 [Pseudocercospora fuligena]
MIAASAVHLQTPIARKLSHLAMEALWRTVYQQCEELRDMSGDLQQLQAFALQLHVALWGGEKKPGHKADYLNGFICNLLRSGKSFEDTTDEQCQLSSEDEVSVLEAKWRSWALQESRRRLAFHWYVHCAHEATSSMKSMTLSYWELRMPLPTARSLWLARSAEEWQSLVTTSAKKFSASTKLTLRDIIHSPDLVQSYELDTEVAISAASFCLIAMTWEDQHRVAFGVAEDNDSFYDEIGVLHAQLEEKYRSLSDSAFNKHTMVLELQRVYAHAPITLAERLMRGEDLREDEIKQLLRWRDPTRARRAVWHAAQLIRALRDISEVSDFTVVASYHATLCLWLYNQFAWTRGHEIEQVPSGQCQTSEASHSKAPLAREAETIVLDFEESLEDYEKRLDEADALEDEEYQDEEYLDFLEQKSPEEEAAQKWIKDGVGTPVLTSNVDGSHVPLTSTSAIMKEVADLLKAKFQAKRRYCAVLESACHRLGAVAALEEAREKQVVVMTLAPPARPSSHTGTSLGEESGRKSSPSAEAEAAKHRVELDLSQSRKVDEQPRTSISAMTPPADFGAAEKQAEREKEAERELERPWEVEEQREGSVKWYI